MDLSKLNECIIEGIRNKKGKDIVLMDLSEIDQSICESYIVCHGTSNVQVAAIAESIDEEVRKNLDTKPFRKQGLENSEWVLIDYFDTVVHIFQKPIRDHYNIEQLWADAELINIESDN